MDVWVTIGFTYDTDEQKYCLIKGEDEMELCLACTNRLKPKIKAFCYRCKAPRPLDWTTGNKDLDSFIMESWSNMKYKYDAYIRWVEYSRLTDVREMTSLRHQCTHIASWLDLTTNELIHVTLKQIDDAQSLDFYQVIISRCNYNASMHRVKLMIVLFT